MMVIGKIIALMNIMMMIMILIIIIMMAMKTK